MKNIVIFSIAICYSLCFATNDISTIKQRLYIDAVAGATISGVEQYIDLIEENGSFKDLEYKPETIQGVRDLRTHSGRLYSMAYAYILDSQDNKYHLKADLLSKIKTGWHYMAKEAPENRSPSWWWGKIGLPLELWQGLILVDEYIEQKIIDEVYNKYSLRTNSWLPDEAKDNNAGANLADRAIVALTEAVLRKNPDRLREIRYMLEKELCDFQGHHGAGVQPDMSFHQHPIVVGQGNPFHRAQYYPGGYGTGYARQITRLAVWLKDTEYEFSQKAIDTIISYILDGQQWVMRGSTFAPSSLGRGISRRGSVLRSNSDAMTDAVQSILAFGERADELEAYLNRMQNPAFEKDITGNKMFWRSDVMIHRRSDYMFSVRMISERTVRPETGSENKKGYYLGDGFTTIMLDGTEYGANEGDEIFPCWDWELLPGTTVNYKGKVPFATVNVPFPSETSLEAVGSGAFVGGVSNGVYGAAVMDYSRHNVDITAKKSLFFFDEYIVSLATDINCNPENIANVRSSVNQIVLEGDVVYSKGGNIIKLSQSQNIENSKIDWVHHRNTGYIVGNNNAISLYAKEQAGKWSDIGGNTGELSKEVFTLVIEHGSKLNGASYEYVVAPGKSATQFRNFYNSQPFEIIENSPEIQAVYDKNLNMLQAVFFAPSTLEFGQGNQIRTGEAIAIILYIENDKLNVWLADPSQSVKDCRLDIRLNSTNFGSSKVEGYIQKRALIPLPKGLDAGKSVLKVFD